MQEQAETTRFKPLKLDPAVCQKAARYAVRVFDEMSKGSSLLREQSNIAYFDRDEVMPYIGDLLGKGGFNDVYELDRVKLMRECPETQSQRAQVVISRPKLAIKFLSDEALLSPDDACNGSADLLIEAKYLMALSARPHRGIIQLHGVSRNGPAGFGKTDRAGFFLIIDRLYDTLDRRIDIWKELQRRKLTKQPDAHVRKYLKVMYLQRVLVAVDILSALGHLHRLNLIFRDLKPDNVGFDYEGQTKLFDFGLTKELDPSQQTNDSNGQLYTMSGGTGSRRFMAPEVALNEPYGLSADIYSFGILFWEILSLEKAFGDLEVSQHKEMAVLGTTRPEIRPSWGDNIQEILQLCWGRDPLGRPDAPSVLIMMKREIHEILEKDFPFQAQMEARKRQM